MVYFSSSQYTRNNVFDVKIDKLIQMNHYQPTIIHANGIIASTDLVGISLTGGLTGCGTKLLPFRRFVGIITRTCLARHTGELVTPGVAVSSAVLKTVELLRRGDAEVWVGVRVPVTALITWYCIHFKTTEEEKS